LVFAAAFLEGAAGIDFGLVATPALGALVGVRDSVLTLSLPNLILVAIRAIGGGIPTPSLKRLMPYLGAGAAGAAVGVLTLISSPPTFLKWSVGVLVLLFAVYSISRQRIQLDMRDETFFTYLAGFFAGGLSGFSYAGNPISIMYLDSTGAGRARMMRLTYTSALVFGHPERLGRTGGLRVSALRRINSARRRRIPDGKTDPRTHPARFGLRERPGADDCRSARSFDFRAFGVEVRMA
ncbi:MAG: sulfite exporter TauE/SafE family protein, partial [Nitrospinae bacterium]|nr:sulfite exporter TauE/SafE family protein [Nitrospinota bacterium]